MAENNPAYPGYDNFLNAEITEQDIKTSILSLKVGKAAGPDGLISEMFKNSIDLIMLYLLKLFIIKVSEIIIDACGDL